MSKYKVVPVEPTDYMVDAGRSQSSFPLGVYKAMIAAAPAVQGESVATVTEEVFGSDGTSDFISARLPVGTKLYTAPQPTEQKPAPDVAQLVEALEAVMEFGCDPKSNRGGWALEKAESALAAYRKGAES